MIDETPGPTVAAYADTLCGGLWMSDTGAWFTDPNTGRLGMVEWGALAGFSVSSVDGEPFVALIHADETGSTSGAFTVLPMVDVATAARTGVALAVAWRDALETRTVKGN